ncbi:GGDEF domain-containing protein [Ralstonia sp. 1138]|uniref:GGDEF domain-containing protein n=1 Tax=Ralstonia sp. 1138 TaxID=3156423 RepID=UPI00339631A4
MYVDLLTLYLLAVGILLASAGMLFWEHRTNPRRSKALRLLAAGFTTLAFGCTAVLFRRALPGATGAALCNLIMLCGYLLVLSGVAALSGRQHRGAAAGVLIGMALVWVVWGAQWQDVLWNHVSAIPIALVSAMTAREMWRCDALKPLRPRQLVVAVTALHAVLYLARALALPGLVSAYGPAMQAAASKLTMIEGVLYAMVLPMTLLKLIRDEAHGQLLTESQTDYLTRLGNRRWFFEQGARLIDGVGSRPVATLVFDLDRFKAINDRYGHQAGDTVLKVFAEIAQHVLGPDVMLARIGGEEFAALLSGDDARHARARGEAVARCFAEAVQRRSDGAGILATVSIGMAQFDAAMPSLADALAAADKALYRAKSLGGNRLEVAQAAGQVDEAVLS